MRVRSELDEYFRGKKIYGDDLDEAERAKWYRDEKEAYADLGAKEKSTYRYVYHALNKMHGFSALTDGKFDHALGIGSAYGYEFEPVSERIGRITIVDPSQHFLVSDVNGTPVSYHPPDSSGKLPLEQESVDLVTCFGVLHHIPNVSDVIADIHRCMRVGGILLIREPIVSMGDWRVTRPGLTRRERGLPLAVFSELLEKAGFETVRKTVFGFSPLIRLVQGTSILPYNNRFITGMDRILSYLFMWNYRYHRDSLRSRFSPSACFWVLRKKTSRDKNVD